MAKKNVSKLARNKGAHPFRETSDARRNKPGVNPSGPTTGTEAWGLGPGEGKTTGVGQGSLGKKRRNPVQHTPAGRADSGGPEARTFRCADMGNADCRWEVSGRDENEMVSQIEQHHREQHGRRFDERTRRKLLDALRERRAA